MVPLLNTILPRNSGAPIVGLHEVEVGRWLAEAGPGFPVLPLGSIRPEREWLLQRVHWPRACVLPTRPLHPRSITTSTNSISIGTNMTNITIRGFTGSLPAPHTITITNTKNHEQMITTIKHDLTS